MCRFDSLTFSSQYIFKAWKRRQLFVCTLLLWITDGLYLLETFLFPIPRKVPLPWSTVLRVLYLSEGYEQDAVALLSAGETQIVVGGVERPARVAAGVWRPDRAGRYLVEPLTAGEPEQSQHVLPQRLLLQDPEGEKMRGGQVVTIITLLLDDRSHSLFLLVLS